jgi:PKD repeat protein
VRFQLRSDGGATYDGFYFDDFKVMFNENGPVTAPTASFTATQTSICQSQSVNFNDFSSNVPTSWSWNFGDGGTSSNQSPSHIYTMPGVYTVSLTVSNSAGSDTYTLNDYITVLASPTVALTSSDADNTVCITGGSLTLSPTPSSAALSGIGVNGNTFDPSAAGLGTAVVTATYTDSQGCVGTSQLNISVQDCASIENLFYNGVSIHPNPNNGTFIIEGLEVGASIVIYDMSGRLVYSNAIEDENMEVKLDQVRSGLYYLQTVKNGRLGQMKFTVL